MKRVLTGLLLLMTAFQIQAQLHTKERMKYNTRKDSLELNRLNAQFIQDFITNDTVAHNQIIYKDFVCITSSGEIVERDAYMKEWAHGYDSSYLISFTKENESIRIFGDMALVRSETLAVFNDKGTIGRRRGIYTDTYVRVSGRWWCVQAQLGPKK
ncbi:MAG: nuclear transport factor 2 family protein [Chitinophagaceae bacterium]|nr:nuclear transport factor 2 family protein [Chitinophagaceae bacterium]